MIAQVSLAHNNTKSLRHLIHTKVLEEQIFQLRAMIKMHSSGTAFSMKGGIEILEKNLKRLRQR